MDPASVRYNNPGAMWPGPSATKFGSTGYGTLADGNKIATFDDPVNGAAAHFDLLANRYAGMALSDAITKWSGGNSSPAYIASVSKATGLSPDTPITPELLQGPEGLKIAKAMAQVEAGKAYPLSDEQWSAAQAKAFGATPQGILSAAPSPGQSVSAAGTPGGILAGAPLAAVAALPDESQGETDAILANLAKVFSSQPSAPRAYEPLPDILPPNQNLMRLRMAMARR